MMPKRRVLLAAQPECMRWLAVLVRAWRDAGLVVERRAYDSEVQNVLGDMARREDLDAALIIGSRRRAPKTVLRAPFVLDRAGRRVPVGWLPATDPVSLRRFASAAASVHRRNAGQAAVALFGQWHPQYLRIVDRMEVLLRPHLPTFRWTSDIITREGLVAAMGTGLGLGVYVGHGRPKGWVGYHGLRGHHFAEFTGEPFGAIMSLCCRTASRRRTGLSYAESLPLLGVAASSFGAVSDTLHTDNTRWAVAVCDALAGGAATVGELVVKAAPLSSTALGSYRLVGDPLAPLAAACEGVRRAAVVPVFP